MDTSQVKSKSSLGQAVTNHHDPRLQAEEWTSVKHGQAAMSLDLNMGDSLAWA